jgi:hypothetical protein
MSEIYLKLFRKRSKFILILFHHDLLFLRSFANRIFMNINQWMNLK